MNCWCPPETTFRSVDPQVGYSSHLSHCQQLRPWLFGGSRRRQRGVGDCFPAESGAVALTAGESTGTSFSSFAMTGERVSGFRLSFFGALFPGQTAERWPILPQCQQQVCVQKQLLASYAITYPTSWEWSRRSYSPIWCRTSIPNAFRHEWPRRCHQILA